MRGGACSDCTGDTCPIADECDKRTDRGKCEVQKFYALSFIRPDLQKL